MKINLTALLVKSTHRYYKDTSMHTYLFREGWVGIGGVGPSSFPLIEEPPPPSKHLCNVLFYERANAI